MFYYSTHAWQQSSTLHVLAQALAAEGGVESLEIWAVGVLVSGRVELVDAPS